MKRAGKVIALTHYVSTWPYERMVSDIMIANPLSEDCRVVMALWDTGAQTSFINKSLADSLGLIQDSNISVLTAFGEGEGRHASADVYICVEGLPIRTTVVILDDSARIFSDTDVVLGLDFISKGNLSIFTDKDGIKKFSFTYPPRFNLDFKRILDGKMIDSASDQF